MDLLLLLMAARLLMASALRNPAIVLVAAAMLLQFVVDIVYLSQSVGDTYVSGTPLDLGWLVSYVLVAVAALHPSMAAVSSAQMRPEGAKLAPWRMPVLLVPGLVGPATVLGLVWTGAISGEEMDDVLVATVATTLVLVLGAARGLGLIQLANRRADQLQARVDHDALTGLLSRDGFIEHLTRTLEEEPDHDGRLAVIFLDIDDFKTVNDTQGHEAGDLLLVEVATRLQATAPGAVVARFGGDEFALLLREADVESVVALALQSIRAPMFLHGRNVALHASGGSATCEPGMSALELLRCVDVAVHEAKRSSSSWARYEPGMSTALLAARDSRERLVHAMTEGEVVPWFQPVVDLKTGALVGVEALARWVPRGGTPLAAEEWLPAAEQSSLIISVDRVIMRAAIAPARLVAVPLRRDAPGHVREPVRYDAAAVGHRGRDPRRPCARRRCRPTASSSR